MIVWGGTGPGGFIDTGGVYDPAANSWTSTSLVGAPPGRLSHTAVWTGSRMVVWGGEAVVPLDTGGRYDPLADAWASISMLDAPAARYFHTAVWSGSSMIVWGGTNGAPLGAGGQYALGQAVDDDGDGVSECAGDCNDDSASIHPGAVEVCDGLDNDCSGVADDGILPPSGTLLLALVKNGSDAVVSWNEVAGAVGYDAVEGDLAVLTYTSGDFTSSVLACILDDGDVTSVSAGSIPIPGGGFWYLVRGINCAGAGSYDEGVGSQQGSRDAEIAASPNACP
jgi:hypothetical protein